jgi:hypothetical protein
LSSSRSIGGGKQELAVAEYLQEFVFHGQGELYPVGRKTRTEFLPIDSSRLPVFINEFWTSRQRQASSIHEISYRACFKAQLPRFFINLFTKEGEKVYDPFAGRGTTMIEAAIMGRRVAGNDINPLSRILTLPRLSIPNISDVEIRLRQFRLRPVENHIDLSMFYHPQTLCEILSLREYLFERQQTGSEDDVDRWIRMVATNRLTGHSPGFFSVYSLPPNQAISAQKQAVINKRRKQKPEYRDTRALILRKTRRLLSNVSRHEIENLRSAGKNALLLTKDARSTEEIESNSIQLTVTSPPFLDVVQYAADNWLRCWFNHIDPKEIEKRITLSRNIDDWAAVMQGVFHELFRITRPGGFVAFEVGEVRAGKVKLEEYVIPLGLVSGFSCIGVMINAQRFTKTANIWGVSNNRKGTNTNRIVLFVKGNH